MIGTKRITGIKLDNCFYAVGFFIIALSVFISPWLLLSAIFPFMLGRYLKLTNQNRLTFKESGRS